MNSPTRFSLLLCLFFPACPADDAGPDRNDAGPAANYSASLGAEPDFSDVHSRLVVQKWEGVAAMMVLQGSFADGPPPALRTEADRQGNCRLLSYAPSNCTPTCPGSDICINEECREYPQRFTSGTLLWEWEGGSVDIEPDGTRGYYASVDFSDTAESRLTFDNQTLVVPFIDAVVPESDWDELFLNRLGDVELRWTNPIEGARVRLSMTDCEGAHGGIGASELECEGPDTGSLVIASGFIDALDEGNWARGNCGGHTLKRYHASSLTNDGTTRLESISDTVFNYRR